ncbi:hypothetical protein T492DRAFT_873137 [Pavlovales sp. CCMP2436]|nr:hypothetical protein T492DRAFT_873137 [Pavlovales sp. CCMP2436]
MAPTILALRPRGRSQAAGRDLRITNVRTSLGRVVPNGSAPAELGIPTSEDTISRKVAEIYASSDDTLMLVVVGTAHGVLVRRAANCVESILKAPTALELRVGDIVALGPWKPVPNLDDYAFEVVNLSDSATSSAPVHQPHAPLEVGQPDAPTPETVLAPSSVPAFAARPIPSPLRMQTLEELTTQVAESKDMALMAVVETVEAWILAAVDSAEAGSLAAVEMADAAVGSPLGSPARSVAVEMADVALLAAVEMADAAVGSPARSTAVEMADVAVGSSPVGSPARVAAVEMADVASLATVEMADVAVGSSPGRPANACERAEPILLSLPESAPASQDTSVPAGLGKRSAAERSLEEDGGDEPSAKRAAAHAPQEEEATLGSRIRKILDTPTRAARAAEADSAAAGAVDEAAGSEGPEAANGADDDDDVATPPAPAAQPLRFVRVGADEVAQLTQQCSEAVQAADARLAAAHAELLAAQAEKARAQTAMGDLALVLGPLSKRVRRCVERRVGESFDQKSAAWRCDNCAELEEEETCTCWKEEEEYADFKPFKEELLALLRPIREALEEGRHANAVAELAKMGPSAHSSPLPIVGAAKKTADYMDADDCAAPWDVDACRVALCVAREVMAYLNEASDVAVAFNDPGVVRLTPALAAVDIYAALAHYLVDSDFDHAAKREGDGNGDGDLTGFSTTAFCSNAIPEQLLHLAAFESLNTSWVSADTLVQAIGSEAIKFVIEVAHSALDAEAQANPPVAYLNGPQYRALLSAAHEGLEVTAAETGHAKLRAHAERDCP